MTASKIPGHATEEPAAPKVTLVIFSCKGRAHLLQNTLASFRQNCTYPFVETILAMDGEIDPACLSWIQPTHLVQSLQRGGYILSILRALSLVRTTYLFWLEDDWSFNRPVEIPLLLNTLAAHEAWVQIRLSKTAPLTEAAQFAPLDAVGFFRSSDGFSANPHLGRTSHLVAGFQAYLSSERTVENTFEPFLNNWFTEHKLECVVQDPGNNPPIAHTGYLESSGRQWHAAISLSGQPAPYSSGLLQDGRPPKKRHRIFLFVRLIGAAIRVGLRALFIPSAYDLGFRFIDLSRRKDE